MIANYSYNINHIPKNTASNRRPGNTIKPTTITIHNTGNPTSTAQNERDWLTNPSNNRQASFHIVVDDKQAIECIPLTENAWHAGDGSGKTSGNMTSISIEICESGNYEQAVENAADLVARLLKDRHWQVKHNLKRHFDWSGKICPRLMYDGGKWTGWEDFKQKVQQKLEEDDSTMILSKYQRDALVTTLTDLNKKGLFTDQNWIKRAQDGSLTVSELTWLNTMIIARK